MMNMRSLIHLNRICSDTNKTYSKLALILQSTRNYSSCRTANTNSLLNNEHRISHLDCANTCRDNKYTLTRKNNNFTKNANTRSFSLSSTSFAKGKDRGKEKKKPTVVQINLNELAAVVNLEQLTSQMDKAVEDLKNNYIKHLTLRSTTGAIEQINITWEGKEYTLQELAQIARKPKTVVLNISSFPQVIPKIIEAISKSGLNLSPQQDGTTLFIPIPKVTKEHRENLSKNAKALFIKCRDNIKDVQNKHIKSLKKRTDLSEDLIHNMQNQIQALTERYVVDADKIFQTKQKELLGGPE